MCNLYSSPSKDMFFGKNTKWGGQMENEAIPDLWSSMSE